MDRSPALLKAKELLAHSRKALVLGRDHRLRLRQAAALLRDFQRQVEDELGRVEPDGAGDS